MLMERLTSYRWPGNARELRNTIERAVILADTQQLDIHHLPPHFGEDEATSAQAASSAEKTGAAAQPTVLEDMVHVPLGSTVDQAEKQLILRTLISTRNNKTRAAEILGISSKTLQNKLKEYASDPHKAS